MNPAGAFMDFLHLLRRKGLTKPRLRCRIGERKCREIWGVRGSVYEKAPSRPAEVYEEGGTCCGIAVRIRLWGGAPVLRRALPGRTATGSKTGSNNPPEQHR